MMTKPIRSATSIGAVLGLLLAAGVAAAEVAPTDVTETVFPGETIEVDKTVTTPAIPPVVDICLLEDETGSFADDIGNLQGGSTASDLYDTIVATSPGAEFAVAGFRDYPVSPHGGFGDHVYRLLSGMNASKAAWLAGIAALTASGGADTPEAQYDAIVAAAGPGVFNDPTQGPQDDCGWRPLAAGAQRVLVVAVDSAFHLPGPSKPHVNDQASTVAALDAQGIAVLGLKAPGAGMELNNLVGALAQGGSVQPLSSDGANIAQAILDGLEELTTDVWWELGSCDAELAVSLTPDVHEDIAGETPVEFDETIVVPNDTPPGDYHCEVNFIANEFPSEGETIGTQTIWITVVPIPVPIDIKPGSDPNGVNVNPNGKGGKVPVAILSTVDFDATSMVNPDTVVLTGGGTTAACWTTKSSEDVNGDGLLDQVYHCENYPRIFVCGDTEGVLTGNFYDGRAFEGRDSVKPEPCH